MDNTTTQPDDKQALAMVKAIGMQESGGNYNQAPETAGTSLGGAYMYQKQTWQNYAGQILGDSNAPFTPENQDKVTYGMVKKWKDANQQPDQIAHNWNPGDPTYPQQVLNKLAQIAPQYQNSQNPTPNTTQPNQDQNPQPGLIPQLGGNLNEAVGGIGESMGGVGGLFMGKDNAGKNLANVGQGLLHIGGAIGGALGNITNAILDQIPLVKPLENLVSGGVGKLVQTPVGQYILNQYKDFQTKNPELAQDAGDVFNILTAIPILKGLGVAKNMALDATSMAFKNMAEKSGATGLEEIITKYGKNKAGARFLADNPTIGKDLVSERAGLTLENGNFVTKDDVANSWNIIQDKGSQIQEILDSANKSKYTIGNEDPNTIFNNTLNGYTDRFGNKIEGLSKSEFTPQQVLDNARNLTQQKGKLWTKFIQGNASLSEINELRSALDEAVKTGYSAIHEPPIKTQMGMDLAGAMRDFVQTQAPETQSLFGDISKQFRIQKGLGFIEGQSPKMGAVGGAIKIAGTLAGEGAGKVAGVHPLISAGIGYRLTSAFEKLHPSSISRNILQRTAPGAARQSLKSLGWLSAAPLQNQVNSQNQP